ncbi:voltage-dependent T-type calcium channel subunit alpha-1G-like [Leptodactylus fuscus]|uniref:voltage-dependent T-type calcium channel subunit alpha-1G-like n=1 Tax=Leptodactylus fuscus TaxID=238119 RepID=UPI003F4ED720
MKHLEESNKEAKEEAELEAEMELEFQIQNMQSPDNDNFLWAGRDLGYAQDSPYGYLNSVKDKVDSQSLVHPMERHMFDTISLLIQGSLEGEMKLMDNLSGSVCHHYALPPYDKSPSDQQIPLAEMEGLSMTSDIMSEKSWSLALTDDSLPDDIMFSVLESKGEYSPLQKSATTKESHLLSVKKPLVCRTHSLPNDSYMLRTEHVCAECQAQRNISCHKSGSSSHVDGRCPLQDAALNDVRSELVIPKLCAPLRSPSTHRMLRRQKAVQNDSFELFMDNQGDAAENLVSLPVCQLPTNVPTVRNTAEPERTLCQVDKQTVPPPPCPESGLCPLTWKASAQERSHVLKTSSQCHQDFGLRTCQALTFYSAAYSLSQKVQLENSNNVVLRDMKKFYSMDAQRALKKKTASWLEDSRRHSIEVCSLENTKSPHPTSRSCGFISHILNEREDLQTRASLPHCPECAPCLQAQALPPQSHSLDSKDPPTTAEPSLPEMSIS